MKEEVIKTKDKEFNNDSPIEKKNFRERSRDKDKNYIKKKNNNEEIEFFSEDNIITDNKDKTKINRKNRIKKIQEQFKSINSDGDDSNININEKSINNQKNTEKNEQKDNISNEMMIKYLANQREMYEKQGKDSVSSTPDMFGDDNGSNNEKNINENNNNLDLGLLSNNESIGYYIPKLNDFISDKYKVIGLCGKGIFSSVLKVLNIENNKIYAMKVIRNINIMKISGVKEKDIIQTLNNDDKENESHIIKLISSFEFNNHICMVLPLYKMNLRELLKRNYKNGLSINHIQIIAKQLFSAFIQVHKHRYIHADFKPDNTLIDESLNNIYVCDFGSVISYDESIITSELVSRYYRAPEIILGLKPTSKIDIWSIGCSLFEFYTGLILFPGKNNNEMIKMFLEYNGRFLNKLLKSGEYIGLYFTEDLNYFKLLEKDNKNQSQIKLKDVNTIKNKDLSGIILNHCKRKGDSEKKVKKFINLLEYCLNIDPFKRISAIDAYTHPFFWE